MLDNVGTTKRIYKRDQYGYRKIQNMKKRTPKKTYSKKVISYTMQPDVVEALENIMKNEDLNTIHKAINTCILQRAMTLEVNRNLSEVSLQMQRELDHYKDASEDLTSALTRLSKHTKRSSGS